MKSIYRAALIAAAFVFILPLSARSEIKGGSFEVNPFVGYNFFESSQNLKNAPIYGGRLGYNFTKYFGIELAGEYIWTRLDDKAKTDNTEGEFGYPMDRVELAFYHIDAVLHFIPDGRFNPFIVAGFGGAHYDPRISTADMAAFNVGLGAKYWLTDNIALRVDLKDYIVTEIMQETYHNLGATVGIVFAFGGKEKPKPAPEPMAKEKVEEKVVVAAAEPEIIVIAYEDINFDFDQSTLTPEAQTILKRNIQILEDNPKAKVRIGGYASASGTDEYNRKLSERRANAVQEFLLNEGIAQDRLSIIGYGETRPAMHETASQDIYSKEAKANMRVRFEIIEQ